MLAAKSAVFARLVESVGPRMQHLEAYLQAQIGEFDVALRDELRHCFGHSGKKLRPLLVFLTAGNAGDEAAVIRAGAIVEMVHLATLVHDDILDGAAYRHRTQTVVARTSAHIAVLLGDALFARALELAAEYPDPAVCRAVARATRLVCSGEIEQTLAGAGHGVDRATYLRIIERKTAELFAVSAWLGGYVAGWTATACAAADGFARQMGMAYQLYDDVVDILADEAESGKTLGTDLASGKLTLPMLYLLEQTAEAEQAGLRAALLEGAVGRAELKLALVEQPQVFARLHGQYAQFIGAARGHLAALPKTAEHETLGELLGYLETAWERMSPVPTPVDCC